MLESPSTPPVSTAIVASSFARQKVIFSILVFLTILVTAYQMPGPDKAKRQRITLPTPAHIAAGIRAQTAQLRQINWQQFIVKKGDTLSTIFERLGVNPTTAIPIALASKGVYPLTKIKPGDKLSILMDAEKRILQLIYPIDAEQTLKIKQQDAQFSAQLETRPLQVRQVNTQVRIEGSLFESGLAAGLSESSIMDIAQIFRYEIDFDQDLSPGDRLNIIREAKYANQQWVKDGDILAAEFIADGKSYRLVRFVMPNGDVKYADPSGKITERAFIRTPIAFGHVSSPFSRSRFHPVLARWRAHTGVDYAAPIGTPVLATANARVVTAGVQGGYGKLVVLQYNKNISMYYGHLSRFAKGIRRGSRVERGQVIGYVGQTGLASGPHLHYEFRVNGTPRNPLTVALPNAEPLPAQYREAFQQQANQYITALDRMKSGPQLATRG